MAEEDNPWDLPPGCSDEQMRSKSHMSWGTWEPTHDVAAACVGNEVGGKEKRDPPPPVVSERGPGRSKSVPWPHLQSLRGKRGLSKQPHCFRGAVTAASGAPQWLRLTSPVVLSGEFSPG